MALHYVSMSATADVSSCLGLRNSMIGEQVPKKKTRFKLLKTIFKLLLTKKR